MNKNKQRTIGFSNKAILSTAILSVWVFSMVRFWWERDLHVLDVSSVGNNSRGNSIRQDYNNAERSSIHWANSSTSSSSAVVLINGTTTTSFPDDIELPPHVQQEVNEIVRRFPQECTSKQHALAILLQAVGRIRTITSKQCTALPSEEQVSARYGRDPVVIGMDTCQAFRQNVQQAQQKQQQQQQQQQQQTQTTTSKQRQHVAATVRVAGLYNTGTNALAQSFERNLQQDHKIWDNAPKRRSYILRLGGIDWAEHYITPWGKHFPPWYRGKRTVREDRLIDLNTVLPVVMVRDPYIWMQSMCKVSYDTHWNKTFGDGSGRCPHLVQPNNEPNPVTVTMESKYLEHYSSLVGFWNDWYQAYVEADFPRLIIRHEDMLWHGEKVTGMIAECAGLSRRLPFTFGFGASKWHGWSANLPKSLGKLQEPSSRQALTPRDAEFAQRELNAELMELFHYT